MFFRQKFYYFMRSHIIWNHVQWGIAVLTADGTTFFEDSFKHKVNYHVSQDAVSNDLLTSSNEVVCVSSPPPCVLCNTGAWSRSPKLCGPNRHRSQNKNVPWPYPFPDNPLCAHRFVRYWLLGCRWGYRYTRESSRNIHTSAKKDLWVNI